jgi:hypothetical protein
MEAKQENKTEETTDNYLKFCLGKEAYEKLKAWLESGVRFEISRSGKEGEVYIINSTAIEKQNLTKAMDEEMIEVKVELFSPFVKFLKEYLSFFGCKKPLEDLLREMIYERTEYLFSELGGFVHGKSYFLNGGDWFWKHPHLSAVSDNEEDEEEQKEDS